MITKSYYKLVRVSYADSDYFRITNVDTTTGTLTINGSNNLGCNIEYSTDGVNFTTADPNAPFSLTVPAGANVYMRGTNSKLDNKAINMDVNHTVGGNVYSILDKATYASRTSTSATDEFHGLFENNTHLVSAEDLNFGNVTTITSINAYAYMFRGCTALTTAPELPATTLYEYCYSHMFDGCTALTTAPELPATTLVTSCYSNMFKGCSSINTITCSATNPNNSYSYNWVNGVAANGTFYKNENATWTTGANGIPSGWTVVDA